MASTQRPTGNTGHHLSSPALLEPASMPRRMAVFPSSSSSQPPLSLESTLKLDRPLSTPSYKPSDPLAIGTAPGTPPAVRRAATCSGDPVHAKHH